MLAEKSDEQILSKTHRLYATSIQACPALRAQTATARFTARGSSTKNSLKKQPKRPSNACTKLTANCPSV
jgi:hypothetical protein